MPTTSVCPTFPAQAAYAAHTATPLAKAQITLHLPSLLKHPSAPLSPASGNRIPSPRRSVFPMPAISVLPTFPAQIAPRRTYRTCARARLSSPFFPCQTPFCAARPRRFRILDVALLRSNWRPPARNIFPALSLRRPLCQRQACCWRIVSRRVCKKQNARQFGGRRLRARSGACGQWRLRVANQLLVRVQIAYRKNRRSQRPGDRVR